MDEIANGWDDAVPSGLFDYIGDLILQEAQANCPVDKGTLKASGKKTKVGKYSVEVSFDLPYATPVDKGHRTRSGSFVPAQPFFSSAVTKYGGTALIKTATEKSQKHIQTVFSRYKSRGP